MLKLLTETQEKRIINNVVKSVFKGIKHLNKQGYNFLYLAGGFIAHYNINGFKHHYSYASLKDEILRHKSFNQWANFREGEKDYHYYKQKAKIYNAICEKINTQVQLTFA